MHVSFTTYFLKIQLKMKFVTIIFVCFLSAAASFSQNIAEKYSLVRVWFSPQFSLEDAENAGLEIEHSVIKKDLYIETTATETTLNFLKEKSAETEIIITDLSEFYKNRANQDQKFLKDFKNDRTLRGQTVPQNFKLGSMAGFYTLEEIYAQFSSMHDKFPDLISLPEKIGTSIEGREILAYRISTPVFTNAKIEVLYTALHHAREPGGVTALVYFFWDIMERFKNGDPEAKYLLENRELYVIPVINPDGYAFNQQMNPEGGGMWRKNRRKVDNDTYGVDLNRNYGPQESWDAPVNGSSKNPDLETYRGSAQFSEPETQAVRNFCRAHNIKNALNYHTYGGLLIYPFATKQHETPDSATFRGMAAEFIKVNKYAAGTGLQTVGYNVRGDSDEWMYLTESQKGKMFAMTPEVGTILDGFWPAPSRIIPQAQENLSMNYQLAWSAGVNIRPQNIEADAEKISVEFSNIGLIASDDSTEFSAHSLDPLVELSAPFKKISRLANRQLEKISFPYYLSSGFKNGERVKIEVITLQHNVTRRDTMQVQLFKSNITTLFSGNDNGLWNKGNSWEIITDHFSVTAFTDSPFGNYANSLENYLTYSQPISLSGVSHATLRFKTRWSIESNADFAVVQVSDNNGASWKTLQTSRMKTGLGLSGSQQKKGEFGFDGNFPEWTEQEASLDQFSGKNIRLRFGMLADVGDNFDGWYLADIKLLTYDNTTGISDNFLLKESFSVYPNPALKNSEITIMNPFKTTSFVEVEIIDTEGKSIFKNDNFFKNETEKISLKNFAAGSYRIILRSNGREVLKSFVVL
jgi:hypothetical protein